jgi:hypothetical protein
MSKTFIALVPLLGICLVGCGPRTKLEKAAAGNAVAQYELGR